MWNTNKPQINILKSTLFIELSRALLWYSCLENNNIDKFITYWLLDIALLYTTSTFCKNWISSTSNNQTNNQGINTFLPKTNFYTLIKYIFYGLNHIIFIKTYSTILFISENKMFDLLLRLDFLQSSYYHVQVFKI